MLAYWPRRRTQLRDLLATEPHVPIRRQAVPTGAVIPEETLQWLMAYAREKKIPLLFQENLVLDGKYSGVRNRGYGPPAFVEHVKTAVGPEDIMRL